jgi:hypothetical protein
MRGDFENSMGLPMTTYMNRSSCKKKVPLFSPRNGARET